MERNSKRRKARRKPFTFKSTLIFNFVLVALMPLVLVAIMTLYVLTGHLEREITRKNFLLAKSLSGEIGVFLHEPKDVLREIAVMIEGGAIENRDLFDASLMSIMANYPVFERTEVLDRTGRVIAVAPYRKDYMGLNMSGRRFFQEMQTTKDVYWSLSSISPYTGEPILTVSLPVKDGILAGILNLRVLTGFIDRLKQGPITISVLDKNGTYIASSVRSRVHQRVNVRTDEGIRLALLGIEGTYRIERDGVDTLMCIALIPDSQWPVVVSETVADAFAPIRQVRGIMWIGIGVAVVLALMVAFILIRRTLKPLSQLILNARNITNGAYDFSAKPSVYAEIDELIDKSVTLFGRTKKEIEIHVKYQDGVWTVEVDHGQMEQVLMNLFVNAWQAMPGRGDHVSYLSPGFSIGCGKGRERR